MLLWLDSYQEALGLVYTEFIECPCNKDFEVLTSFHLNFNVKVFLFNFFCLKFETKVDSKWI